MMDRIKRHLLRLFLPIMLALFGAAAALAQNGAWTISETKGSVVIIDTRGEHAARAGQALEAGAILRTEARASAVLVRGSEFVTVRQNAQIRIPAAARSRSIIQIVQDYGSALFNIGKKADPHFGVETPYLAAVVKGTTFVITVGADSATLQVTEGAVEASTRDGGARELVRPGAVAMVAAADALRLVIEGDERRVIDSPARGAASPAPAPDPISEPAEAAPPAPSPEPVANSEQVAQDMRPAPSAYRAEQRIDAVIASSPGDVRGYTGGFVAGEVAVIAAAIVADNTARGNAAPFSAATPAMSDAAICYRGACGLESGRDVAAVGAGRGEAAPEAAAYRPETPAIPPRDRDTVPVPGPAPVTPAPIADSNAGNSNPVSNNPGGGSGNAGQNGNGSPVAGGNPSPGNPNAGNPGNGSAASGNPTGPAGNGGPPNAGGPANSGNAGGNGNPGNSGNPNPGSAGGNPGNSDPGNGNGAGSGANGGAGNASGGNNAGGTASNPNSSNPNSGNANGGAGNAGAAGNAPSGAGAQGNPNAGAPNPGSGGNQGGAGPSGGSNYGSNNAGNNGGSSAEDGGANSGSDRPGNSGAGGQARPGGRGRGNGGVGVRLRIGGNGGLVGAEAGAATSGANVSAQGPYTPTDHYSRSDFTRRAADDLSHAVRPD